MLEARSRWATAFRLLLASTGLVPWLVAGSQVPLLNQVFAGTCHRMPARSLVLQGVQMVVCSRCAGIYLGLATGALLPAQGWALRWPRLTAIAAALPMAVDVFTQDLGLHPSWHPARLGTGFLLGLGLTMLAVTQMQDWSHPAPLDSPSGLP